MLNNVAVVAFDGVAPFEFGVLCEAFGVDRAAHGVPSIDFAVCTPAGAPVRMRMGLTVQAEHGLERVAEADLVGVPAMPYGDVAPESVLQVLREAHARGAKRISFRRAKFSMRAGLRRLLLDLIGLRPASWTLSNSGPSACVRRSMPRACP